MTQHESNTQWSYYQNLTDKPLGFSLQTFLEYLSCIGCLGWITYTFVGLLNYFQKPHPYNKNDPDLSGLIYDTYFCTYKGDISRSVILLFSISQLIISSGLLFGVFKAHRNLVVLCWALMCGLLFKRLHRCLLSDCPSDFRAIVHIIYAFVEIWYILLFITEKEQPEQSLYELPRTIHTQLNLVGFNRRNSRNLNDLETPENEPPLVSVTVRANGNSITNMCDNSFHEPVDSSIAELPPAYDNSIGDNNHQGTNVDSNETCPPYVDVVVSTDLPPSYEDCVTTDATNNLLKAV